MPGLTAAGGRDIMVGRAFGSCARGGFPIRAGAGRGRGAFPLSHDPIIKDSAGKVKTAAGVIQDNHNILCSRIVFAALNHNMLCFAAFCNFGKVLHFFCNFC